MRVHYPSRSIKKEIKDAGLEVCRKLEKHHPTVNQMKQNNFSEQKIEGKGARATL